MVNYIPLMHQYIYICILDIKYLSIKYLYLYVYCNILYMYCNVYVKYKI